MQQLFIQHLHIAQINIIVQKNIKQLHFVKYVLCNTHQIKNEIFYQGLHCMENVRIRSFFGSYSSAFRLNKERYSVFSRKTPNTDTFQAVLWSNTTNIPDRKLQQIKGKFEIHVISTLNILVLKISKACPKCCQFGIL